MLAAPSALEIPPKVREIVRRLKEEQILDTSICPSLGCNRFIQVLHDILTDVKDYSVFESVTTLDFSNCIMGDQGFRELLLLFDKFRPTIVKTLRLSCNWLWPASIAALLNLDIFQCIPANTHLPTFTPFLDFSQLEELDLRHNHLGDEGVTYLCLAMLKGYLPALRTLLLDGNGITDTGATLLFNTLSLRQSTYIDIPAHTLITQPHADDSATRALNIVPIVELSVASNRIGNAAVLALLRCLGGEDMTEQRALVAAEAPPPEPVGKRLRPRGEDSLPHSLPHSAGGTHGTVSASLSATLTPGKRDKQLSAELVDAVGKAEKIAQQKNSLTAPGVVTWTQLFVLRCVYGVRGPASSAPAVTPAIGAAHKDKAPGKRVGQGLGPLLTSAQPVKPAPLPCVFACLQRLDLSHNRIGFGHLGKLCEQARAHATLRSLFVDGCVSYQYCDTAGNTPRRNERYFAARSHQQALTAAAVHRRSPGHWMPERAPSQPLVLPYHECAQRVEYGYYAHTILAPDPLLPRGQPWRPLYPMPPGAPHPHGRAAARASVLPNVTHARYGPPDERPPTVPTQMQAAAAEAEAAVAAASAIAASKLMPRIDSAVPMPARLSRPLAHYRESTIGAVVDTRTLYDPDVVLADTRLARDLFTARARAAVKLAREAPDADTSSEEGNASMSSVSPHATVLDVSYSRSACMQTNPFMLREAIALRQAHSVAQNKAALPLAEVLTTLLCTTHPRAGYDSPLRALQPRGAVNVDFLPVAADGVSAGAFFRADARPLSPPTPTATLPPIVRAASRGAGEMRTVSAPQPVHIEAGNPLDRVLDNAPDIRELLAHVGGDLPASGASVLFLGVACASAERGEACATMEGRALVPPDTSKSAAGGSVGLFGEDADNSLGDAVDGPPSARGDDLLVLPPLRSQSRALSSRSRSISRAATPVRTGEGASTPTARNIGNKLNNTVAAVGVVRPEAPVAVPVVVMTEPVPVAPASVPSSVAPVSEQLSLTTEDLGKLLKHLALYLP